MTAIGEPNYCALIVDEAQLAHLRCSCLQIFKKTLNPEELRSQIITLIIRVSAQLEQFGMSFQKINHMRVIRSSPHCPLTSFTSDPPLILLSFYICDTDFYVMISSSSYFTRETDALRKVIEDILVDHKPLYTSLPAVHVVEHSINWDELEMPYTEA